MHDLESKLEGFWKEMDKGKTHSQVPSLGSILETADFTLLVQCTLTEDMFMLIILFSR